MQGIKRRNDFLHLGGNLGMIFHVRLADIPIDHDHQRVTHDALFGLEVIENEGKDITQHANQFVLASPPAFRPATTAIRKRLVVDANLAQICDGRNQKSMLEIDQPMTGNQFRGQLSSHPPVGGNTGQCIGGPIPANRD
eukprot:TRINITY_DN832_c0_g1_i6.p2 TRINITY_DN832_c0_g1~~TRINITY_DN832_c0_g1_i6.p2  ORF type:complete len:139 (+),score=1.64 TRINITY_DN832_c0_g1_i6:379-795(+)